MITTIEEKIEELKKDGSPISDDVTKIEKIYA